MPKYTMKELSEESGLSARTIRYYITQGLVPKAVGQGRKAYYTIEHLKRLREIQLGTDSGLRLDQLCLAPIAAESRLSEAWIHYKLGPGVVLTVRSDVPTHKIRRYAKDFAKELKER